MKICKICGSQAEDYATFCTNCGSTFEQAQPQYQQPANNYYSQPEVADVTAEENPEAEAVVIDEVSTEAFAKAAKSAKLMSIISTCLTGVLLPMAGIGCIMAILFAFLNYFGFIFTGPVAIAAIVFLVLYFINAKKVKPFLGVDLETVEPQFSEICATIAKNAKLAKTLGLVSTILLVLDALALLFVFVWPFIWLVICLIFGFSGALLDMF